MVTGSHYSISMLPMATAAPSLFQFFSYIKEDFCYSVCHYLVSLIFNVVYPAKLAVMKSPLSNFLTLLIKLVLNNNIDKFLRLFRHKRIVCLNILNIYH